MINFTFQLFTEGTALSCEVISSQQQVTAPQQINTEKTTQQTVSVNVLKLWGEDPEDPKRIHPESLSGASQESHNEAKTEE